jgi:hypothetical protein
VTSSRKNKFFCAGSLAVAAIVSVVQWNSAANLRRENQDLANANREAAHLTRENGQIPRLRAENAEIERLRAETRDLLRLRNEVRQLRDQKPELEKLRAENQRLAGQIKSNSGARQKLADLPDFVSKETWSEAGLATPEATVRTFFSAMRDGNLKRVFECFANGEKIAADLVDPNTGKPDEQKLEGMKRMMAIKGFRIAERKELAEDRIVLGLQVVTGGEIMPLPLRRIGQEWKLDTF